MSAVRAMVPLMIRAAATRGRLVAMGSLGVIGVLIAVAISRASGADTDAADFVSLYVLQLMLPLIALVVATSTIGTLNENRTMVYLWLRPIGSWTIAAAALVGGLIVTLAMVVPFSLLMAVVLGGGDDILASMVSTAAGSVAYVGLFTFLGALTQRGLMVGLIYLLIWEQFIAGLSAGMARFSVLGYTRSLLGRIADVAVVDDPFKVVTSVIVLLAVGAVMFLAITRRVASQEVA